MSSLWVHADMSTSTQRYGWVAGRSAWKANYKIKDLLTRPLSGDVNAALLSRAHGKYVVAENNGGGIVNANRAAAGPWETFAIHDINGGKLQSTDPIYIGTSAGWFFCADHTLTRDFPWQDWRVVWQLNATRRNADAWERMTIYKMNAAKLAAGVYETTAGDIVDGDFVIIQSYAGNFMVAEANGAANINRPNFNAWEVFQFKKK